VSTSNLFSSDTNCLCTGLRALRTMDMENKENAEEPERRTELTVQSESLVFSVTCEKGLG